MIFSEYEKMKTIVNDTFPLSLRENTLNFLTYLNENSIEFERLSGYWKNQLYWMAKYNNECICYILLNGKGDEKQFFPLTIWTDDSGSDWYSFCELSEKMKKLAHENVDYCVHCGSCSGGQEKIIFGKNFTNICKTVMRFTNPEKPVFDLIKILIEARKRDISY